MVRLLGSGVLVNKTLDRRCIANLIFHDLELLKALETLVHPVVYVAIEQNLIAVLLGSFLYLRRPC